MSVVAPKIRTFMDQGLCQTLPSNHGESTLEHYTTEFVQELMIITTTPTVEGKHIRDYRGIVTGETILAPTFSGISSPGFAILWEADRRRTRKSFATRVKWQWQRWRRAQRNWVQTPLLASISITKCCVNNGMSRQVSGTAVVVELAVELFIRALHARSQEPLCCG